MALEFTKIDISSLKYFKLHVHFKMCKSNLKKKNLKSNGTSGGRAEGGASPEAGAAMVGTMCHVPRAQSTVPFASCRLEILHTKFLLVH